MKIRHRPLQHALILVPNRASLCLTVETSRFRRPAYGALSAIDERYARVKKRADVVLEHRAGSDHNHPLIEKAPVMAISNSTAPASRSEIERQIAALYQMTVPLLRQRHLDVFGHETGTHNKLHLIRKIAWRIQALAEGDLSERARQRATELARDADVRVRPPKDFAVAKANGGSITVPVQTDPRLPSIGDAIVRTYKGQKVRVIVLADGFEYDGRRFRSLSAVAKAISGSHCNGFRFFKLEESR